MTVEALLGLLCLNGLYLAAGASVLWWTRGWSTWVEFARLAGLAYVCGVALVGTTLSLLVIAGVPFTGWLVLGVPLVLGGVGVAGARRQARARPTRGTIAPTRSLYVTAAGIALTGVFLEGLFRKARLNGLYWWDAWSFWIPKAKAIYLLRGLDEQFFTILPGPAYPPLVPVLDAAAFVAMRGPDVVTLHVQFWFFGVGVVWALAGLLHSNVPAWIMWPSVLLLLVAPRIGKRFMIPEADLLLDSFFVLAAVLVAFWIADRARWQLLLATPFLAAMVLTKREGTLLVAALLLSSLLATSRRWRKDWPALGIAALVVVGCGAAWRAWYVAHGIPGEGPSGGGLDPTVDTDRLWPSLRLAVEVVMDSGYWSVITTVALGAFVLAALARVGAQALYFAILVFLVVVGGAWITWANPELPVTAELGANPIVRYMGAAAMVCAVASPLLLAAAWRRVAHAESAEDDAR